MPGAPRRHGGGSERLALVVLGLAAAATRCSVAGGLAMVLGGHGWHELAPDRAPTLTAGVLGHPAAPALAWPARLWPELGGIACLYASAAATLAMPSAGVVAVRRRRVASARPHQRPAPPAPRRRPGRLSDSP